MLDLKQIETLKSLIGEGSKNIEVVNIEILKDTFEKVLKITEDIATKKDENEFYVIPWNSIPVDNENNFKIYKYKKAYNTKIMKNEITYVETDLKYMLPNF